MADCPHPDRWSPPVRCTGCGHRTGTGARPPAESKTLPWWTWPFEYAWRLEARLMRSQPARVRDALSPPG